MLDWNSRYWQSSADWSTNEEGWSPFVLLTIRRQSPISRSVGDEMYARLIRAISVARKILRSVEYDTYMKYYTPIQDLDYIRNQLLAWAIKFRLMCVVYIRDDKKFKQNVPRMKKFQYCISCGEIGISNDNELYRSCVNVLFIAKRKNT